METHSNSGVAIAALLVALTCCPASAALARQQAAAATRTDEAAVARTTVRVRGTIEHYDTAARRLRVTTPTGPTEFAVPRTARVSRRGAPIDARELEHLTGSSVVVRYYTDAEDHLTVRSIHVLASSETTRP
ncbi:MAG TPA: hypothetical protein VH417_19205 [Vicinamibacterales bacterium]|jgi:hypothetical protein